MVNKKLSSRLGVRKQIISNRYIHNLYTILFVKIHEINKIFIDNSVNQKGKISLQSGVSNYPTLNVISFNLTASEREKLETILSQLCNQYLIIRIYSKQTKGRFTRIFGKTCAPTVLQYTNKINNSPIRQVKYALI